MGLALTLPSGCVYEQEGPPRAHFEQFAAKPPEANTVTVCHAYGCKAQTPFTFSQNDIRDIAVVMDQVRRDDSASEERRSLAYAVAWMERRVAPKVGTASDRPSMDFFGSGDPSQEDCVDEATNTTSYLIMLQRNGLLHHHTVERPFAKDDASHWTHWAAVIREKESGERFAMDSSSGANGENPTVQAAASFYVPDDDGDVTPPEGRAVADANSDGRALAYDDLGALIQRMQALGYADAPTGSMR
ncbi:MAG: hypothetical protein WBW08_02950 [Methyloceanibacter sp.]